MIVQLDSEAKEQIMQCLNLLIGILEADLLGVYLYGSAIVGGLQKYSDIDLFVVSDRATTYQEKAKLVTALLTISGIYMKSLKRPIEMTVVVKSEVNPWQYPSKFDFQYGEWLRTEFESGHIEPWSAKEMPELALLITQVLLASKNLWGPNPEQLLSRVPYQDFIHATTAAIGSLMDDLNWDTRNVLLTLARVWSTVETNQIRSKPDAASWAINRLPEDGRLVMRRARAICVGEKNEYWGDINPLIQSCAKFMLSQINKQIVLLKSSNYANKSISYAE